MMPILIDQILQDKRVLIHCGTGGVGKTTISAAMAIRAAVMGKKAVVITIDPAKRLAHSLGMEMLSNRAFDLTPQIETSFQRAKKNGMVLPDKLIGKISAIVPDTRQTFDDFVTELASSPEQADRIRNNPIFKIFAREFSGTNEYMALERLLSVYQLRDFDCIILDTPPSRNTLAFLNAPQLLSQFFEEKVIRWFVLPANRLFAGGMKKVLGILEQLTGAGFMRNFFEFAASLFEVQIKFKLSLKKIMTLLASKEVGFLMVTTPNPDNLVEIQHFIDQLKERSFEFEGIALNKTVDFLDFESMNEDQPTLGFEKAFEIIRVMKKRENSVMKHLSEHSVPVCARFPELSRDIHSVEDLFHVAMAPGPISHHLASPS